MERFTQIPNHNVLSFRYVEPSNAHSRKRYFVSQSDKRIRDLEARATSLETRATNTENRFGNYYTAAQVNSKLGNYYTKSETYKRTEVDTKVSSSGGYRDFTKVNVAISGTPSLSGGHCYVTYTMPADGEVSIYANGYSTINGKRVPRVERQSCDWDSENNMNNCSNEPSYISGKAKKGDVIVEDLGTHHWTSWTSTTCSKSYLSTYQSAIVTKYYNPDR